MSSWGRFDETISDVIQWKNLKWPNVNLY
jgi:hypothetical protein